MKGSILDFITADGKGAIAGDDGNRYMFEGKDWNAQASQPRPGLRVDFVAAEGMAMEVYVDSTVPGAAPGASWGASAPALAEQRLDPRYGGLYCSSDEKMVLGLCAGLAHKLGIQVTVVRAIVFIVMWFVLWIPYLIGFFLPKLPTRGVPRPV